MTTVKGKDPVVPASVKEPSKNNSEDTSEVSSHISSKVLVDEGGNTIGEEILTATVVTNINAVIDSLEKSEIPGKTLAIGKLKGAIIKLQKGE